MRKLTQLWQGLERVTGLAGVPALWEQCCGTDFSLIRPHLRPTDDFGATFPCPHPNNGDCPRRIVNHGDGEFVAICRHPHKLCDDVPLAPKEALIYRLDIDSLMRNLADALCVRPQPVQMKARGVWNLGLSTSRPTRNVPAYLLVFSQLSGFRSALRDLALSSPTPFVAIAPTATHLAVELREELGRRRSHFISIEERVGLSEDGRFVGLELTDVDEISPTPVHQRRAVVARYKRHFDCTDQAIYGPVGVHKSDFYKWMNGTLPDTSSKAKRIEETLRIPPRLRPSR
jgi:hypothetical protein